MFRMPSSGGTSKNPDAVEEKKLARQHVWRNVYFFVGYIAVLRLGKINPNLRLCATKL